MQNEELRYNDCIALIVWLYGHAWFMIDRKKRIVMP